MISKGTAGDLLNIHSSDKVYILAEVQHSSQTRFQINTSTETQIIYWDPNHVVESSNGLWRSPATTLAHEAGHAARYDEAVKNGTITQWLSGCENDESNPYDNHEDEIVITTTEQVVAKKHGEICEGQVTRTDHRGKQVPGDVSNKSPWEIQKDIYEHNELLK